MATPTSIEADQEGAEGSLPDTYKKLSDVHMLVCRKMQVKISRAPRQLFQAVYTKQTLSGAATTITKCSER